MSKVVLWIALAGCGRFDFGRLQDGGDDTSEDGRDGPAQMFCDTVSPPPALCADFDRGLPLEAGFTSSMFVNGGAIAFAPGAKSQPNAFQATMAPPAPSMYTMAILSYVHPTQVASYQLDYELFVPSRVPMGHIEVNNVTITAAGIGNFYTDLDLVGAGDRYLQEESPNVGSFMNTELPIAQLAPGAWHHVSMAVDLAHRTYLFVIDGTTESSGAAAYPIAPGLLELQIGVAYAINEPVPTSVYVDNVVLRVE